MTNSLFYEQNWGRSKKKCDQIGCEVDLPTSEFFEEAAGMEMLMDDC